MKKAFFRYSFVSGLCVLLCYLSACEATKRVAADDYLLRENKVYVNGTPTDDAKINNFIFQKPNSYILGLPVSLYIYNWANPHSEEEFVQWLDNHPRWHARIFFGIRY